MVLRSESAPGEPGSSCLRALVRDRENQSTKVSAYLKGLRSFSTYDATAGVQLNLTLRFPDDLTLSSKAHREFTRRQEPDSLEGSRGFDLTGDL